jgi:L-Ala-D/L-Glu epimerase
MPSCRRVSIERPAQYHGIPNMTNARSWVGPMEFTVTRESWPYKAPFRISGRTFTTSDTVTVSIESRGYRGQGEAAGIFYKGDTPAKVFSDIHACLPQLKAGVDRAQLQTLLPPSGARNAIDCALWDLETKLLGHDAWQIAGLTLPRALLTTFTCGAAAPDEMAKAAKAYAGARAIKLKLTGEAIDVDRVTAVREACPTVWLGVDANQGFDRSMLEFAMPAFLRAKVELIEQPVAIGEEWRLDGFRSPIPLAADESFLSIDDLPRLIGRFSVVNIKLDKCGGLTEALAIARRATSMGLSVMVGNMAGTSLAMAPAFVVGQLCDVVDLDGPALLRSDRTDPVIYRDGFIDCSEMSWGRPELRGG